MSTISNALKKAREVFYLVEIDFDGLIKRWSTKNIGVPVTGGDDRLFEAMLTDNIKTGTSLDLNSMTYSLQSISMTVINKIRLQDQQTRRRLDGSTGTVYIWCDGLTWADISSAGIIMQGLFKTVNYDKYNFSFTLTEQPQIRFKEVPLNNIDTETWVNHRIAGATGSVAGLPQQIVFGDWPRGVPVLNVDTVGFKYLAMAGISLSTNAEYAATTENLYDVDDAVIAPGVSPYTFYPSGIDEQGNPCAYFDFVNNPVNTDPKHCSIRGLTDSDGTITGTAGTLIEHPADIDHYLMKIFTTLDLDEIGIESLRTMRTLLSGLKFASLINLTVNVMDVIDRILFQCQYARIQRSGKIGVVGLHTEAFNLSVAKRWGQTGKTVKITSTPDIAICNNVTANYNLNGFTKKYESVITRNRTNSDLCKRSFYQYGARPQKILNFSDVQNEQTAIALINRYIEINAFRHEIAERETTVDEGFDVLEGDCGLLTVEEGSSADGSGWTDEPCILIDRKFNNNIISQRWWRIVA